MGRTTGLPHYEHGDHVGVAFMFACPGWHEEFHGRPAAGATGYDLHILLGILTAWGVPDVPSRVGLTIANASKKVLYEERDGRSLPLLTDVKKPANLNRLASEVGHITGWLVCAGKQAQSAGDLLLYDKRRKHSPRRLHPSCNIVKIPHLGMQAVNQIKRDVFGIPISSLPITDKEGWKKTRLRLETVAKEMLEQLNLQAYVPTPEVLADGTTIGRRTWGDILLHFPNSVTQSQRLRHIRSLTRKQFELITEFSDGSRMWSAYRLIRPRTAKAQ